MTRRSAIVFGLVATFAAVSSSAGAQALGIAVGKRAPAAVVQTLSGKPIDLGSYVGKGPMLIEFWATWCPQCHELEPALLAAHRKYGSRVRFVGVAVSIRQSPAKIRAYAAKHGLKHELLFDAEGNAADVYDAPATSYVVVVNKAGTIVYTGLGGDQDLEAAIRKAL
jgi:thiol-disulfide isomerase/thioredoxin